MYMLVLVVITIQNSTLSCRIQFQLKSFGLIFHLFLAGRQYFSLRILRSGVGGK